MNQTSDHALHELLFHARRSSRYHMRRVAFYDRWQKLSSALSVIFGSAAVGVLLTNASNHLAAYAAATVAVFGALDLVVGTANKTRLHGELRRRWLELERSIICEREPANRLGEYQTECILIEADEPPVMRALDSICQCDLLQAEGYTPDECDYPKVRWFERWTAHLINWPSLNAWEKGREKTGAGRLPATAP